jgi:protein TonB
VNGNGLVAEYLPDSLVQYHEINDSVVVVSFTNDGQEHLIYSVMEQHPEYPGGYGVLAKDLQSSLKYPKSARKKGIEGTVYVSFIVDVDGHITEPQVLKGIQAECDAAAVEAVGKLNNWKPGMHDDKPVCVRYVLPIKFSLKGWSLF